MGDVPDSPARRGLGAALLWVFAAALLGWVVAWPWLAGMVAMNDDLKFVRVAVPGSTVGERIAEAWRADPTFRPLEIAAGASCDPWSLGPGYTPALQAFGVLAASAAVVALARRVVPVSSAAPPLALCLFALSPATSVSAWQVDTVSQTWTAAIGAWCVLLAHDAVARGQGRRPAVLPSLALAGLLSLGCAVKETGLGWSAGIALALVAAGAFGRRAPGVLPRCVVAAVPCLLIPAAIVIARLATGSLGSLASGDEGAKYSAQFGANLLMNAALSLGGLSGNGPFHLLTDDGAPPLLRALPVVSVLATVALACVTALLAAVNRRGAGGVRWGLLLLAWVAALASLALTLPMGSVGELYGMGANVVASVALAALARAAWNPVARDEVLLGRVACTACLVALLAVGSTGLAGRASAFASTWRVATAMNGPIVEAVRASERDRRDLTVHFSLPCFEGRTYGQYVTPPLQTIDPGRSSQWFDSVTPNCSVMLSPDAAPADLGPGRLLIDCSGLAGAVSR